ncbi:MAG: glycosyltransferase [Pleurocapsa minor GSE-CHR-MK-17-07R]|jgi:cellulose synthase/poly-beta-1,6-N-acetylglucosamine synthase-like glycosyltransferase|nr:glycosyltransferase [Pleurocapsa minor GSE-CHR-MK 17-07R]
MALLVTVLSTVYVVSGVLLTLCAFSILILLVQYLLHRHERVTAAALTAETLPTVAVQLPIYNELYVVERLVRACAALDYPRDRLIIQVLDDSTDETQQTAQAVCADLQAQGVDVRYVHRENRVGYKAGALAHGLTLLPPDVQYVAIFDADFVPRPDFLHRTVPYLVQNERVGLVQARWSHLNREENVLTRWQAFAVDGHFVIEQTARSRSGLLMNFNGTCGVWRISAIQDSGGWSDNTLAEDLDLSYRAQLKGWRFMYLPEVDVPGELPPQIAAFKEQQARWAKGGTQCMKLLIPRIWKDPHLSLGQKLMGSMHLSQYLAHPLIILMLLCAPILLILSGSLPNLPIGPLAYAWIAPPMVFVVSQGALYKDWKRRVLQIPALFAFGTGIAWSNARAVTSGILSRKSEFKRTPKYARMAASNKYAAARVSRNVYVEIFLSLYAFAGAYIALRFSPAAMPYLLTYGFAFAVVAFWGLRDVWEVRRAAAHA